eukprot:5453126-Pyramimonas_sp.AAC.1
MLHFLLHPEPSFQAGEKTSFHAFQSARNCTRAPRAGNGGALEGPAVGPRLLSFIRGARERRLVALLSRAEASPQREKTSLYGAGDVAP